MSESEPKSAGQLTVVPSAKAPRISAAVAATIVVPAIVADAGDQAARRFLEFFAVTIRNKNTRAAYLHAVSRFFAWCEHHQLGQLADIEPLHVATYIEPGPILHADLVSCGEGSFYSPQSAKAGQPMRPRNTAKGDFPAQRRLQ
jgi:hypothetical protein